MLLNQMCVDDELLAFFKSRYKEWELAGLPKCDEKLIPLLKAFNKIEGVATVFGCEGHPEKEDSNFYIMFAANRIGLDSIIEFITLFKDKINNELFNKIEVISGLLDLLINTELTFTNKMFPNCGVYPAIILSINNRFSDEETKELIFKYLNETITELDYTGLKIHDAEWDKIETG